jgi:hypothetical protein
MDTTRDRCYSGVEAGADERVYNIAPGFLNSKFVQGIKRTPAG